MQVVTMRAGKTLTYEANMIYEAAPSLWPGFVSHWSTLLSSISKKNTLFKIFICFLVQNIN